jgi:hypothetical protein
MLAIKAAYNRLSNPDFAVYCLGEWDNCDIILDDIRFSSELLPPSQITDSGVIFCRPMQPLSCTFRMNTASGQFSS